MQSGMQYYQHRPARKQSPALETPLPEFIPPQGQRGQDIMIIWDFQNVRTPTELEPVEIIRFMYDTFVKQPGPRRCAGAFCTFTDSTKKAVGEKRFNQFCSNGVLNFMMINSPGGPRKADDSDHPLKEMMMNFTVDCVRGSKDGVLLLITADADFVRPAIWCKQQGCVSLELIYYDPIASKEIRQLEANWKMEWRDFLDCMMGRRCAWTFPYPQDVAAGLAPSNSSSSPGTGNYQYYSNGGSSSSSGYQQDQQRRYQQQRQQQQQQLHLPGPPPRLALPPPSGSSSGRQGYGTAAAAGGGGGGSVAAGGAITVSNTHVDQAAEQLLHNPAALQQVVQQYKQSMQTTAVLQQVLQGVAQKATSSSVTAAGAAAPGPAAQAYMRGSTTHLQQQQQQQRVAPGVFTMSPSKPVNVLRRDAAAAAAAASSSSTAAAAAGASPYTWQQREQPSARLTPENSSTSGSGRSPPPPEWWDPSASSGGNKARRSSKGAVAAGGSGSMSRHGSSNGIWGGSGFDGGRAMSEGHSSNSEGDDAGFWDSSRPAGDALAANRSNSGGRGLQAGSGSSGALSGADTATSSAAVGTGLPPPPSMGLMKRATGPVPGSGGKTSGSGGNLVALLAAAAANAGGGSTSCSPAKAARGLPGHQSPHHHHHSQGSDGVLSPIDKHEQHHQATLAAAAAAADGSYQQPRLQQQLSYGSLDQLRSPSPALTNRSDRSTSAQDRHMQHHEQQLMLAMQRGSKQRPFHDTGDTAGAAAADKGASSSGAMVNLFGGGGRASGPGSSSCGDSGSPRQDHSGIWARPKPTSVGPGMAAAARILSRATAEAAADASRATGSHDGAGQGVYEGAAGGDEGVGTARRSSTGGGVEIMEAPPLPPWMQQQQGQEAVVQGQQQQQRPQLQSAANTAASSAREGGEEEEEEYVEDEETGEVILVKKPRQPRSLPKVPQQQQQQQSSLPISIAAAGPGADGAVRGRALVGPDDAYEGSSEGGVTPSNTPCAGIASWQAAGGGSRMHFSSTQQPQHSRLHQWQQAAAAADSPTDGRAHDAPADDASGSCSVSCKSSSCSLNQCSICGEGRGGAAQHDDDADSCCVDQPLAVSIVSQPIPSSSSGKDSPRLVRLQLEVRTAEGPGHSSSSAAVDTSCGADAEASSSSSGRGVVCGAADGDDEAAELMQPLLDSLEGDSVGPEAEPLVHTGRHTGSQHPFPHLSTELQALAAISQGLVGGSYAGEDMLPLPADADRHNRGLQGLTLLGPVLGPHDAAAGAGGISPHHRPKQRSLVEQLEELQHILSADMAAEAAAAVGDAAAGGQEEGDPLDADAASSAARASADGSEGSVPDDGLGFEAVGLDGLPVYGPHAQPESHSSSEIEDDEAKLLRMLAAAAAAAPEPQDDAADDDISLERMLQLLNAGSQPAAAGIDMGGLSAAQSSPMVVSAPPMPLRALSGSPVTAITELGNVSSAGSSSSRGMQ